MCRLWKINKLSARNFCFKINKSVLIVSSNIVNKTKDYILAGDIFEANITNKFFTQIPNDFDFFNLYKQTRNLNPAPFAFAIAASFFASGSVSRKAASHSDGKYL